MIKKISLLSLFWLCGYTSLSSMMRDDIDTDSDNESGLIDHSEQNKANLQLKRLKAQYQAWLWANQKSTTITLLDKGLGYPRSTFSLREIRNNVAQQDIWLTAQLIAFMPHLETIQLFGNHSAIITQTNHLLRRTNKQFRLSNPFRTVDQPAIYQLIRN